MTTRSAGGSGSLSRCQHGLSRMLKIENVVRERQTVFLLTAQQQLRASQNGAAVAAGRRGIVHAGEVSISRTFEFLQGTWTAREARC